MNFMQKKMEALVSCNIDCSKAYEKAAVEVKNENFRNFLKNYAVHRKAFADELSKRFSAEFDLEVSKIATMPCKRMEKRLESTGGVPSEIKDKAILRACGMAEDIAILAYENALSGKEISEETSKILHRHRNHLIAARRIIADLTPIIYHQAGHNSAV